MKYPHTREATHQSGAHLSSFLEEVLYKSMNELMKWPLSPKIKKCNHDNYLKHFGQVTLGRQLQTLLLCPGLNLPKSPPEQLTPYASAQVQLWLKHEAVKQPHVDEVKELREQLDRQSGIDTTSTKNRHG